MFFFDAGSPVYQMVNPDGLAYVMQAYCTGVDATMSQESLGTLGQRLALPAGWSYRERALERELVVDTTQTIATVLQDEFENSYTLPVAPAALTPRLPTRLDVGQHLLDGTHGHGRKSGIRLGVVRNDLYGLGQGMALARSQVSSSTASRSRKRSPPGATEHGPGRDHIGGGIATPATPEI